MEWPDEKDRQLLAQEPDEASRQEFIDRFVVLKAVSKQLAEAREEGEDHSKLLEKCDSSDTANLLLDALSFGDRFSDVIKLILEHGNFQRGIKDFFGPAMAPKWVSDSYDPVTQLRRLIDIGGIDPNGAPSSVCPALCQAVLLPSEQATSIIQMLVFHPRVDVNATCRWEHFDKRHTLAMDVNMDYCNPEHTALHFLMMRMQHGATMDMLEALLSSPHLDVNCKDSNDRTPLMFAAASERAFRKPDSWANAPLTDFRYERIRRLLRDPRIDFTLTGTSFYDPYGDSEAFALFCVNRGLWLGRQYTELIDIAMKTEQLYLDIQRDLFEYELDILEQNINIDGFIPLV